MSQASPTSVPVNVEKSLTLIEQEGKGEDWFFKLYLPAVIVLFIVGSIILLS